MKLKKIPYLLFIIATICLITSCNNKCKHKSTYWEIDKQATCTEDGIKHKECTVCHKKLVTEVIESLGHDLVHHEKEDPTCTEKGHKAYDTCTRCNYITYEKLPATGHTESEWIIDKQATCMKIGIKHKECTVCHEKLDTEVIESLGHDLVHHEKEDPTCTEKGHKAYNTCTRCDYTTYEELPATGHTESNWIIDVDATCTETGSKHKECTVCHEKLDTEVIESLGHDLVHHEKKDSTCTEKGYKEYYSCTRCSYTTYEEIPELGHIYEDGICTRCRYELTSSDLLYELTSDNAGYLVTGLDYSKYDINALTIIIPSEYNGLPVVGINDSAFENEKKIKCIILPNCITYIGSSAFDGCDSLNYNIYDEGYYLGNAENKYFALIKTSGKNITNIILQNNVKIIGTSVFFGCRNLTYIVIPDSVTSIGFSAFEECTSLTSIEIPDSVTSIGDSAFKGCKSLTNIEIPDSVTSIGNSAFENCTRLKSIGIPNSLKSIGKIAFRNCTSLTNVYYKGTVENWCNISFLGGSESNPMCHKGYFYMMDENNKYKEVTEIVIPETITKIGDYQFYGFNNVKNINIPNTVTSIGNSAFRGCRSLTNIEISDSVTSIGNYAFDGCKSLTNIEIPNGVTSIGYFAFCGCANLTNIEIPDGVTSIGYSAFMGCTSLKTIKIPNGVTSIGEYVFRGCTNLTSIEIPNSVTNIGKSAFEDCTSLINIEVPINATSIGHSTFSGCTSLTSIKIPSSVISVGWSAFKGCTSLTNIEISFGLTSIGTSAFEGCTSLTSIKIPSSVISVGWSVFKGCTSLTNIEISAGLTSIGNYAFYGCTGLTSINISGSLTSIGESAFNGCASLTNVYYNGTIEDWCNISFGNYESNPMKYASHFYMLDENNKYKEVTEIVIPETITKIGDYQFYGFNNVKNINIPNTVTSIGNYAFDGCKSLTNIIIPNSVTTVGLFAFSSGTNLTIYCEALEKPSGWNDYWKTDDCKVEWGYKKSN